MDIRAQWTALVARIDALELRQRGLVLLAVIVVLFVVWDQLLMNPLETRRQSLSNQVGQVRSEIDTLNGSIQDMAARSARDPDAPLRAQVELLQSKISALNENLEALTGELIPPRTMPEVLESLMTQDASLELVRLEGLGAAPVIESVSTGESGLGPVPGLYRHGLRLVFRGSYLDTLDLLEEIEALPWRFIWSRVNIEIRKYPKSMVTLELYSLSLDEAWLEV